MKNKYNHISTSGSNSSSNNHHLIVIKIIIMITRIIIAIIIGKLASEEFTQLKSTIFRVINVDFFRTKFMNFWKIV